MRALAALAAAVLAAGLLAACGPEERASAPPAGTTSAAPAGPGDSSAGGHSAGPVPAGRERPLREGERRLDLRMPEAYEPSAPTRGGTDDYRCFLLDPGLTEDTFVTGVDVRPGNPEVVHHVILYAVPPEHVAEAEDQDAVSSGQGWTCFGGTGMGGGSTGLDDAPWLGAWAPGGRESVMRPGYGTRLAAGSRIVMQVHYNLLVGHGPDVSAARLRVADRAPDGGPVAPVTTMLLPAPVELPCRPGHDASPLCDRETSVADVNRRFGMAGGAADLLHLLCGTAIRPGQVTTCDRTIRRPTTVMGVAGHMHLLGRSIRIELNPGRPGHRTLLDMPLWDFDNQQARPLRRPARLEPGNVVRVTCRHDQGLRDVLPAFDGQEERYVVWGEGTTDEMCLGILQVTGGAA
ncbi:hypothetical protein [Nocardioides marmoribigeumensis]|uniref:Monooxygenase n=1 Tax=Nocardioides marmoribigeumensis TaxID=433649 RepID=A0ABU2BYM0_9ACTN|nr:hypothetical protein [Nocardioides marmoribigeumensis]MDR7363490.1 hypothetical protein [Nocardioides marmoribigeumensis]